SPAWEKLDAADAIVLGCPTYMGSPSAGLKQFMEATSSRWMTQTWADKLAAGFTNSGSQNGDKQNTLVGIATFAAQHGMVWINLNLLPGNNSSSGSVDDLNRLGASLGAMAQSNVDESADVVPPQADLDTARRLGERVATCAQRWSE
ncbi:MAG: flavodoxin family protein, partial [Gammaproteobacteria bacterium]|nr:flavodoxin family protein [Gammaproteobacteria bacterium]